MRRKWHKKIYGLCFFKPERQVATLRHDKYCAVYFLQNAFFHLDPVGFCRLSPLDYTQLHVSPFCIQILTETATVHYINCDLTHFLNSNSFLRSREMALYLSYQLCVCVTLVCVCGHGHLGDCCPCG